MSQFPLGLPEGSVRALISLGVVLAVAGIGAYLIVEDSGSDMAKVVAGGLIASLGQVVASYFGSRQ